MGTDYDGRFPVFGQRGREQRLTRKFDTCTDRVAVEDTSQSLGLGNLTVHTRTMGMVDHSLEEDLHRPRRSVSLGFT